MDIQQIRYFLALAKELHFWNTSEKVGITQSALSRQIMSLESELNVKLFNRDKRNVNLTDAGLFLKEKWQAEVSALEMIHQQARQIHLGESGTIKIAHPDSLSSSFIPEILSKISAAFPKLNIELLQLPYSEEDDALKNYRIDILFNRDINQSAFLHSKRLATEPLCLVVPTDHHFTTIEDITASNLSDQKFILTHGGGDSSYDMLLEDIFKHYDIHPASNISTQFGSTVISLIKKGLGISILPESYVHYDGTFVRFIPLPFCSDLYINWRKDDSNIIIRNIIDLL